MSSPTVHAGFNDGIDVSIVSPRSFSGGALSPRRTWWAMFAALGAAMTLWALSMPLFSSPDEPSHVVKAAAVVRGQFSGHDEARKNGTTVTIVRIPGDLIGPTPPCYAHRPTVSAACQSRKERPATTVQAGTLAGHYPPLYYLLVGVGSLVAHGHAALYLMRLLSAALSAAFLASAWLSMLRWRSRLACIGFAAAASPMVLFMGAGVNPSGFEITSALCVWASLLAVLAQPQTADRRLLIRLLLASSALMSSRGLSPLWLAVIVVICVLASGWSAVRAALQRRDAQVVVAAAVFVGLLACTWILAAGALNVQPRQQRSVLSRWAALAASYHRSPRRIGQMIGNFGWLDTPAPFWTNLAWIAAVSVVVLLCAATAKRAGVGALLVLILTALFLPVLIEASQERSLGLVWQGRYTLPIAVGVPLLAARCSDLSSVGSANVFARRLALWLVPVLMSAQYWAFRLNLSRNTVGLGLRPSRRVWKPPLLPTSLFLMLYAIALVGVALTLLWSSSSIAAREDRTDTARPNEVGQGSVATVTQ